MATLTTQPTLSAQYRYFVCDLVTNELLAELPLSNVSYGRSIKEAGSFTGDIPVSPETYNLSLYENTVPGKTALYIVRNNQCVWGGIIWSRSYDIKNRVLNISGNEFTSYLYHRTAWKTFDNGYNVTVTLQTNGIGKLELQDNDSFDFAPNMPIQLVFGSELNQKYNGYYYIVDDPAPTTTVAYFTAQKDGNGFISVQGVTRSDTQTAMYVRQDTYEYARDLISALELDFYGPIFGNTEIEPSQVFAQIVTNVSRTSNIGTAVFDKPHYLIAGQGFSLRNTVSALNGRHVVLDVPNENTITFESTGTDIPNTALTSNESTIASYARAKTGVVTVTTAGSHSFNVGDVVDVSGLTSLIDGPQIVTGTTSTTLTFQTDTTVVIATSTAADGATVELKAEARYGSYGEYTTNSGLDLSFSTGGFSIQSPQNNHPFRGHELKYVGEILDEYSNTPNGFEYRIDCAYDPNTNKFTRTFVFLPLEPDSLTDYKAALPNAKLPAGKYAPISAFEADRYVFEHPGNILGATMVESAEDAATRFWIQGDDDTGNSNAALPYAAESNFDYLDAGWPLLDQVEKINGVSEESILYDKYATRLLAESVPPISNFSITVDGSIRPTLGTYAPGDWCSIIINDEFVQLRIQSQLEAGSSQADRAGILLRKIDAFEVSVPESPTVPEEVTLTLVTETQIDTAGETLIDLSTTTVAANSVGFTIKFDTVREPGSSTTVALFRGSSQLNSWTLAGDDILDTTYTATGLSANTKYEFKLKVNGTTYITLYVRTAGTSL
jgi:hypothetical protein